jgi:hypothetical protein
MKKLTVCGLSVIDFTLANVYLLLRYHATKVESKVRSILSAGQDTAAKRGGLDDCHGQEVEKKIIDM